jgi:hypothetical protein
MSDQDKIIYGPFAAVAVKEGETLIISSQAHTQSTTVNDTVVGVAAESSIDDTGTALTLEAGDFWGYYPLGCGATVNCISLTGQTWRYGAIVYNAQSASADGRVETSSSGTATKIGRYVGPDNVLTSGETLIRVHLCFAPIG